jgi:hypothetical protein
MVSPKFSIKIKLRIDFLNNRNAYQSFLPNTTVNLLDYLFPVITLRLYFNGMDFGIHNDVLTYNFICKFFKNNY